jgi:ABC-type uncharacterized transport system permease subunit
MNEWFLPLFYSMLRVSTPLIFAAMGGFFSERAGVINIALEGFLLVGAFAAASAAHFAQDPWIGLLAGATLSALFALVYAVIVLEFKANQIVAGVAMNLFAMGLTPLVCNILFHSTGASPSLPLEARFKFAPLILAAAGTVVIYFWSQHTVSGLWHQMAGEKPLALRNAGVGVKKIRYAFLAASGAMAGLGGACLSIFLSSAFSRNMSAGRGYIALAALILGRWKPIPTALACLLFAFAESLQIHLQSVEITPGIVVPTQWIYMIPYLLTLIALAGLFGASKAPSALGKTDY